MSAISLLLCFIVSLAISTVCSLEEQDSIYEALKDQGLPMGLFPKAIRDFSLDESGRFEVRLDQACNSKFESELHFDRNVSGTLSYGQIGSLSGISAQELFLWFPVTGIRVDVPSSGIIYFDVGVVRKQFSLSLFETPRDCIAVRDGINEIENKKAIAEADSKSPYVTLRFGIDQQKFGKSVLLRMHDTHYNSEEPVLVHTWMPVNTAERD